MATKSIGLTGRDYSTLAGWASYVNALSLSAAEVGEVYNDGGAVADTAVVTVGGWSGASGTNTVTLRAAVGQGFQANASVRSNALRWNASNGAAFTNSSNATTGVYTLTGNYLRIQGLQFKTTDNAAQTVAVGSGGTDVRMTDCIVECHSTTSFSGPVDCKYGTAMLENVLAILVNAHVAHGYQALGSSTLTGCVAVCLPGGAGGAGFSRDTSGTPTVINCVSRGFATDFNSYTANAFHASSRNNATDLSSFTESNPSTSGQTSLVAATEWENLSSGTHDLRLKSSSTKLKNNGATSGSGYDISGTARSGGYDIGVWEYTGGAAVDLAGVAAGVASAVGAVTHGVPLAGAATGAATASGGLATTVPLAGGATGAAAATGALSVAPRLTSSPLKNNTGALLVGAACEAFVHDPTTGALVVKKTGLTTHASSGIVSFSDASLVGGTAYRVIWRMTTGGAEGLETLTAS